MQDSKMNKINASHGRLQEAFWLCALLIACTFFAGCNSVGAENASIRGTGDNSSDASIIAESPEVGTANSKGDQVEEGSIIELPETLAQIPQGYLAPATDQGSLENLQYDTYESFSYEQHSQTISKRAVVYLPYGYSETEHYPVVYLMHGGWSDETTYLGVPGSERAFKNVLDHAIQDGLMVPMIVVCPTYNNTSGDDSDNYSLALRLTDNYHNELVNDLIPAVEGKYNTYAANTTLAGLEASRDYRAFAGFSMGSVTTWRTFQYSLDYFRYFLPSSGSLTTDGTYMASLVRESGHAWNDFFIFAASGTEDFAYSSFRAQIEAMSRAGNDAFRFANNERNGNLYFLVQEGNTHDHNAAMQYVFNGLCWLWY